MIRPFALWLAACAAVAPAGGQEPAPRARIEFRWLEPVPIKGVTGDGIRTTCGETLSYPRLAPVLTAADVASATVTAQDFSRSSPLLGELYTVTFHLKDDARRKLSAEIGDAKSRELATFVDGRYWGTRVLTPASARTADPSAGFTASRAEAGRWAQACT